MITFRQATAADVPDLVALIESAYRGESSRAGWTTEADLLDGQRTDIEGVAGIIDTPAAIMLIALLDGRMVGCCMLEKRSAGVCYFGSFAVQPGLQGGGVGKLLLAESERLARDDWGCASMEMSVISLRRDLIAWYERRGYVATGQTRPFPYGDERAGLPKRDDLVFAVLTKPLA